MNLLRIFIALLALASVAFSQSSVILFYYGATVTASGTITRPADTTAYTSGDLVANSTTAGSVTPVTLTVARTAAGSGQIRRVRISKTGTGVTNAAFRVHFYRSAPTVTNGDNGAWLSTQAATYIGSADVTVDKVMSDGAAGQSAAVELHFALVTGTSISALLEARGAYTPASEEVYTITVEVAQN